ncbi:M23 family metallopeptidase [Thalassospiraceae bacterium LMO-SO8]|nr:M23 family metallopeptidase [Alphaproteobacteria bacterium LMO-S08]WND77944.1 M23 family metallopeptidase [Thalassospiraceae bacterium LMO-SO8]
MTNILHTLLLSAAITVAGIQSAFALELSGKFIQGGLVTGKVEPGTKLTLDGQPVAVAPDGSFIIGFGRKAKAKMVLRAEPPEGLPETRELAIEKRKYKVQRINGLPQRKVSPTKPEDLARIKKDQVQIAEVRKRTTLKTFFDTGFMWPVEGPISGVFGSQRILNGEPRSPHNGVDVAAPRGTPVKTMGDGIVALVNQDMFFTGKTVMIDHGLGLTSVYIHMDKITVKEGDFVTKGMQIGTVGATGRVTGPHLHWGVSWFKTHLDPALLVDPQKPIE